MEEVEIRTSALFFPHPAPSPGLFCRAINNIAALPKRLRCAALRLEARADICGGPWWGGSCLPTNFPTMAWQAKRGS
jgi:hypothetical protein